MAYENVEENEDIVDVLFMVISGHGNVKSMIRYLNEKQSTISMKLRFLRKEKLVKKNKWEYAPDWKNIVKLFKRLLTINLNMRCAYKPDFHIKIRTFGDKIFIKNLETYFPNDFIEKFLENYSINYLATGGEYKRSLYDIAGQVVEHLMLLSKDKVKKVNPKFLELKKHLAEFDTDVIHIFMMMKDREYKEWWVGHLNDCIEERF